MPRSTRHIVFKRFKHAIIPMFDEHESQAKVTKDDLIPLYDFFLSRFHRHQQEIQLQFDLLPKNSSDLSISPPIILKIPNKIRLAESLPLLINYCQLTMLHFFGIFSTHLSGLGLPLVLLLSIASFPIGSAVTGPTYCQPAEDKVYAGRIKPVSTTPGPIYRNKAVIQDAPTLTAHTFLLIATTLKNIRLSTSKSKLTSIPVKPLSGRIFTSRSLQTLAPGPPSLVFYSRLYAWHPPETFFLAPGREGIG